MKGVQMIKENLGFILIIIVIFILSITILPNYPSHATMQTEQEQFILLKENIQENMRTERNYRCCLDKPCTYCIEKTPGHGEGAACTCLDDVVNGVHPCGECIGEILEGHGNKYLSQYFAAAIAEKTGHIEAIREIISEKYEISVEEQL